METKTGFGLKCQRWLEEKLCVAEAALIGAFPSLPGDFGKWERRYPNMVIMPRLPHSRPELVQKLRFSFFSLIQTSTCVGSIERSDITSTWVFILVETGVPELPRR